MFSYNRHIWENPCAKIIWTKQENLKVIYENLKYYLLTQTLLSGANIQTTDKTNTNRQECLESLLSSLSKNKNRAVYQFKSKSN